MAHEVAENIMRFNVAVGTILVQLFEAFPIPKDLDRVQAGAALEAVGSMGGLQSNETFLIHTLAWLLHEGYVASNGLMPSEKVYLTEKGLRALNAIPSGLSMPLGSQLIEAVKPQAPEGYRKLSELVGSFFGSGLASYTKALGGG